MDLAKLRSKTGTRKLAGVDVPRENRTSVAFRKAVSAGGDHDGITGGSSHRICRASGGRVKRQDGGSTISEDSKKEAAKLERDSTTGKTVAKTLLSAAPGAAVAALSKGALGKSVGTAAGAVGGLIAGSDQYLKRQEAKRIHEGKVKPGEEDRKSGGSVKKGGK